MFPKRYITATPDNYPDLSIAILSNPTGKLLGDLLAPGYPDQGDADDDLSKQRQAQRLRLGAALVEAYNGAVVEAYGVRLDFSSPAAAVDTLFLPDLPDDLAYWLRNAPIEVGPATRPDLGKSFRSSSAPGRS